MTLDRFRSRLLLALGLGSASLAPACHSSSSKPDAAAKADAHKLDAAGPDGPVTVRRPFVVGASLRSSRRMMRADWIATLPERDAELDPSTRALLALAWERDALEEHASIAAFARFALQLLAVGAPPELIAGAQRAGLDEVRHAQQAFALARRYGGAAIGPAPLRVDDALGARSLAEIAELAAEEGCVGETLGAILAGHQAAIATDPTVQRVLRGLARDELRHAELAWSFVRWASEAGGAPVVEAIVRGVQRASAGTLASPVRTYEVDLAAWHAHGRVTCAEARAIAVTGIAEVIEPALAGLRDRGRQASGDARAVAAS
jgi:hypothetical protein